MLYLINYAGIISLFGSNMHAIVCTPLDKKDKDNIKMTFDKNL